MFESCINKNVKFILSSIFATAACFSLNAEEADTFRENTCRNISRNANLSVYNPKQRQNLSIAATQSGLLTSFGSQSPPE